jgi:hypothetical protein
MKSVSLAGSTTAREAMRSRKLGLGGPCGQTRNLDACSPARLDDDLSWNRRDRPLSTLR